MSQHICEQIETFDAHHKCCTSYTLLKIKSFSTNITHNSNTYDRIIRDIFAVKKGNIAINRM
jgi:hypothetical protein